MKKLLLLALSILGLPYTHPTHATVSEQMQAFRNEFLVQKDEEVKYQKTKRMGTIISGFLAGALFIPGGFGDMQYVNKLFDREKRPKTFRVSAAVGVSSALLPFAGLNAYMAKKGPYILDRIMGGYISALLIAGSAYSIYSQTSDAATEYTEAQSNIIAALGVGIPLVLLWAQTIIHGPIK